MTAREPTDKSKHLSLEQLDGVVGGGADVKLTLINQSQDMNNSRIEVFQAADAIGQVQAQAKAPAPEQPNKPGAGNTSGS